MAFLVNYPLEQFVDGNGFSQLCNPLGHASGCRPFIAEGR